MSLMPSLTDCCPPQITKISDAVKSAVCLFGRPMLLPIGTRVMAQGGIRQILCKGLVAPCGHLQPGCGWVLHVVGKPGRVSNLVSPWSQTRAAWCGGAKSSGNPSLRVHLSRV
ncbi:uncharacterized protein PV07_03966 [Cladophialophora immunda]|uniref:Uncharacterized protein n=1 Tax=Cladophialophora immunda TaxID=569365 RepID=A0A0D2B4B3_9EURO|nr:uncharacterized protein PV07_03966 [Cladophialophora immunda]KIW32417.1 hypothetical protein PV07_03966 [Cladophialophora immunda]